MLLLRAAKELPRSGVAAPAHLGMMFCDDCREKRVAQDFIADEGWAQITSAFRALGKADPVRARTELAWTGPDDRMDKLTRQMYERARAK